MALEIPVLKSGGSFAFQKVRHLFGAMLQEGVVNAGDLKVSQRSAGANMSVDVAAGACAVQGDSTAREGLYFVVNDNLVNVAVAAAHATLPRVDQVVLQGDTPSLSVVAGVATTGATLDNRTGAVALPNSAVRLADILVPAASTSVVVANIRDRRPWARGAYSRIVRTSNAAGNSDYSVTSSTTGSPLDATNLAMRLELSGAPLKLRFSGSGYAGASGTLAIDFDLNGALVGGGSGGLGPLYTGVTSAHPLALLFDHAPSAGSALIKVAAWVGVANGSLYARTSMPLVFTVEEIVRQNASNT